MIVVVAKSKIAAADVVRRALEFVPDVSVRDVSGLESGYEVRFNPAVVANDDELVYIRGNNSWFAE